MLEDYLNEQKLVTKILLDSLNNDKLVQAYLLTCNDLEYLEKYAIAFSKKILSKDNDKKICKQIDDNNYPDLTILYPDGKNIKKEQLSELQKEFQNKPIISNKKVYIITECEKMNAASANSILKFLEEPSDDIIAILLTTNQNMVIPTILSRCQILNLNNIATNKDIYEIMNVRFSELDREDTFETYFSKLLEFTTDIDSMKKKFFIKYKEYNDYFSPKADIKIVVDSMLFFYYDILNLKFERAPIYFNKYIDFLEKVDDNNSKESINYKLEVLEKTKLRLTSNSNIKMILDKLIIELGKEM